MSLILYRRHSRGCAFVDAGRTAPLTACECMLWVYGETATEHFNRQSTQTTDLVAAQALIDALQSNAKGKLAHGPRLSECISEYMLSRKHELGDNTYRQYEYTLERLHDWCEARGAFFASDLTVDALEKFKAALPAEWKITGKATVFAKVRCFLKDAFRRGWIPEDIAGRVTGYRGQHEQKSPFTDAEVARLLDGCSRMRAGHGRYADHPEAFRLLLELMLDTGLRVGDAARYDPNECKPGEALWVYSYYPMKVRRTRQKRQAEAYLSERLKLAIDKCSWLSPERPFLWPNARPAYFTGQVYRRMQEIGRREGIPDCRPHRLRDTFAVNRLLAGMQLEDVSHLLGHSSVVVTEQYYAKWTRGRKVRLERIAAAFKNPSHNTLGNANAPIAPLAKIAS